MLLATALLAGLPLASGDTGRAVAVVALQLALVAAWVLATGIRGFVGSLAIGAAAAVGADLLLGLPERPDLGSLLLVLGPGFLVCVLHQMARPAPRRYLVASLAGVLLLLCAVTAPAVLLALGRVPDGDRLATTAVLVVGAALLAGHAVDLLLPRPAIAAVCRAACRGCCWPWSRGSRSPCCAVRRTTSAACWPPRCSAPPRRGGRAGRRRGLLRRGRPAAARLGAAAVQAVLPFAAAAPVAWFLALQTSL